MSVIVTDQGFSPAPVTEAVTLADIANHKGTLDLAHTDDPEMVEPYLPQLTLIRVAFPAFNDGRTLPLLDACGWLAIPALFARLARSLPTSMRWRGGWDLTVSKSPMIWPCASPKHNGCRVPTGKPTTTSPG